MKDTASTQYKVKGRVILLLLFNLVVAVLSRESFYQTKSLVESH